MKTFIKIMVLCCLIVTGCKSEEQKNAENVAKQQDAVIYSRKNSGQYEMYAELNSRDRRWKESGMRQTSTCIEKNQNKAYECIVEKMNQGTWVWKLVPTVCSECNGKGTVSYGEDHFFVINGLEEANVDLKCPFCNGEGKLLKEVKENE